MKYTVILIRPDWVTKAFASTVKDEADSYIALVEADDVKKAVRKARTEVRKADWKELQRIGTWPSPPTLQSYLFVCAYEGHHEPEILGVQTYMWI